MSMKIQELQQTRAAIVDKQRNLLNKVKARGGELTKSDTVEFDHLEEEFQDVNLKIQTKELEGRETTVASRLDELNKPYNDPWRPGGMNASAERQDNREYETRSGIKILAKNQKITEIKKEKYLPEEKQLNLGKYLKGLVTGDWADAERERSYVNQAATGQYLIPTMLSDTIIDLARNKSRLIEAGARTFEMTERKVTTVRQVDDPTLHWKKENEPIEESDPVFDTVTHEAKTLVGMVRISTEMFQDAHDIEEIIVNALTSGVALELDRVGLFGTGEGEEPKGLYHTLDVPKMDLDPNGKQLENYVPFSKAVEMIRNNNGEPNAVIYAPRTDGVIDRLTDTTGQPLNPPASFQKISKLVTNQVPTNLIKGTSTDATAAFIGDFTQVLYGIRTGVTIDISTDGGDSFNRMQVLIRVYLRGDVQFTRPKHFTVIDGIVE